MREQASPDSTGCHLPAAVTTSCHKHPLGADHPSPGQCLRLDPFYHSSQASAAGRSSSTMHCSQRGHLTPETPSASREVTGAPSNHLQMNLPPETRSASTPDSGNPPNHRPLSPTTQPARCKALPQACGNAARLPAGALQRCLHLCQDSLAGSRPREHWRWLQWIRWGWDIRTEQLPWCATALVLQHHCAPSPRCCGY